MLTAKQKTLLEQAIAKLNEADALVQQALGATDACYDTHCAIEDVISDLEADLETVDA
jgi:DNA-binding MarR family transcriptional regulator